MHVHPMYPPRLGSWMPLFVANGVLGIRDMGSPMKVADVKHLCEEIAAGSQPGPRIIDAGPILDGQKQPPPFSDFFIQVTGTAQGRDLVRSIKAEGFDFVKVYSGLPRDIYFAIVDEAKARKALRSQGTFRRPFLRSKRLTPDRKAWSTCLEFTWRV
jgi:hypothetical protein